MSSSKVPISISIPWYFIQPGRHSPPLHNQYDYGLSAHIPHQFATMRARFHQAHHVPRSSQSIPSPPPEFGDVMRPSCLKLRKRHPRELTILHRNYFICKLLLSANDVTKMTLPRRISLKRIYQSCVNLTWLDKLPVTHNG